MSNPERPEELHQSLILTHKEAEQGAIQDADGVSDTHDDSQNKGVAAMSPDSEVTQPVRRTIHEPNTVQWACGDLVIHDSDAKRPDVLMVVLGRTRAGIYRTRYAFPAFQPKSWRKTIWRNTVKWLHDPRRFGIAIKDDPGAHLNVSALRKARSGPAAEDAQ